MSEAGADDARALYVDPDRDRRERVAEALRERDLEVESAADAPSALGRVLETPFECVVSREALADLDGEWLLSAIRATNPALPVVLVADGDGTTVERTAAEAGAADVVLEEGDVVDDIAECIASVTAPTVSYHDNWDIYERVTDAFMAFDEDWRFVYASERAEELLGRRREDLLGSVLWSTFPDLEGTEIEATLRRVAERREPETVEEYYEPLFAWFELRAFPANDGISVFFQDITDRKERVIALQSERDRTAALFSNTSDCIIYWVYGDDGPVIHDVNPAFVETFGYGKDEVLGENVDELLVPPAGEEEAAEINRQVRRGESVETEVRRQTANGLRDFLLRSIPIARDDDRDAGFGVYTDITKQKEREQRLQVLSRVLRHNLRNDMNVIIGTAQSLLADAEDPDTSAELDRVQRIGRRLLERSTHAHEIEGTIARLDEKRVPVPIDALLERQADALADAHPDVTVETRLEAGATVKADPALETAIEELLSNAVKHHDRDAPTVRITAELDEEGDRVRVRVADDGPGIPDDEQEVLVSEKETPLQHSSGLGLWMVNWVVRASGGDVSIASGDPRGSIVTVRLPAADATPAETPDAAPDATEH